MQLLDSFLFHWFLLGIECCPWTLYAASLQTSGLPISRLVPRNRSFKASYICTVMHLCIPKFSKSMKYSKVFKRHESTAKLLLWNENLLESMKKIATSVFVRQIQKTNNFLSFFFLLLSRLILFRVKLHELTIQKIPNLLFVLPYSSHLWMCTHPLESQEV
jgi:hypothetical protein